VLQGTIRIVFPAPPVNTFELETALRPCTKRSEHLLMAWKIKHTPHKTQNTKSRRIRKELVEGWHTFR